MKNRKIHFDIMRILAILCVIYNHTNEHGYFLYAFPSGIVLKIFYIVVAAFIAVGVPVFFMISGALLLGKEESIVETYKKRVLRIVLVMLVFSTLQYVFLLSTNQAEFSFRWLLDHVIEDNIVPSYWFLYTYLAFLIVLPLLRKLANAMSNEDFKYLILIYLVMEGALSTVLYLVGYEGFNLFLERPFFDRIAIFPLVGFYLEKRLPKEKYTQNGVRKLLLASVAVLALFVVMTLYRNLPYEDFTTYDKGLYTCGFTLVLDMAVFYIIKYYFDIRREGKASNPHLSNVITSIGSMIFGVYLVEGNVRYYTEPLDMAMNPLLGIFPSVVVWVLLIFIISLCISFVMKQIPGLKKIL